MSEKYERLNAEIDKAIQGIKTISRRCKFQNLPRVSGFYCPKDSLPVGNEAALFWNTKGHIWSIGVFKNDQFSDYAGSYDADDVLIWAILKTQEIDRE